MEEELVATVGWIQLCDDLTHDPKPSTALSQARSSATQQVSRNDLLRG